MLHTRSLRLHHEQTSPTNGHTSISSDIFPSPSPQHFHSPPHLPSIPARSPTYPTYPTLSLPHPFRASADVLFGFTPPSQVVADNAASPSPTTQDSAVGGATSERWHSDLLRVLHTPLGPGENLFDPGMDPRRREAILGGWVASDGSEAPEGDVVNVDEELGGDGGKGVADGKKKKNKRGKRGGKGARRKRQRHANGKGGRSGRGGGMGDSSGGGGLEVF
ncbi:hypothetical protein IQ06DRAFT_343759 [Phaeosphaeriaceae sp. SRC1lsM3a]|nr:hypothetical protein IQ06DRAFT_343759 [Stagonospora sp. SRC1lsM3a]